MKSSYTICVTNSAVYRVSWQPPVLTSAEKDCLQGRRVDLPSAASWCSAVFSSSRAPLTSRLDKDFGPLPPITDSLFASAVLQTFYCWTSFLSCWWCMYLERFTTGHELTSQSLLTFRQAKMYLFRRSYHSLTFKWSPFVALEVSVA